MNPISIPIDYESWPDFHQFVRIIKDNRLATYIYLRLWVAIGYQFQTGLHPNGCMPIVEFEAWEEQMAIPNLCAPALLQMLTDSKVLRVDGDYYFCRSFFLANEGLRIAFRDKHLDLYEAKEFYHKLQRCKKKAEQTVVEFPVDYLEVEIDGAKITPEELNQSTAFIRMLDSVLGQRERRKDQFAMGLICDATRLIRRFGTKLELVLKRLHKKRGSTDFAKTSEIICANFDELLIRIEPEVGWADWARLGK